MLTDVWRVHLELATGPTLANILAAKCVSAVLVRLLDCFHRLVNASVLADAETHINRLATQLGNSPINFLYDICQNHACDVVTVFDRLQFVTQLLQIANQTLINCAQFDDSFLMLICFLG